MKRKKCPKCGYSWEARVPNPKLCPECKTRLARLVANIKRGVADAEAGRLTTHVTRPEDLG